MSHLRYDIRAKADPTGTILASFDESEVLLGTKGRYQLHGSGSFLIVVHDDQANVTPTVFAKGNHLTAVDLDLGAGEAIWGGWFDIGDFEAVSLKEKAGRTLSFGGPGDLVYVREATMDSAPYVSSGDGVYNGPRDDMLWHWGQHLDLTFVKIGAILKRIIDEAKDPDRPRNPIPALTYNFTNDTDSASAAWDPLTGGFTLPVGMNYLDCIQAFIKLGLTILMRPTLQLNAYQGQFGTDRSTASFAAGKVRFVAGVNIAGTLKRPIHESVRLRQVLVAGEGTIPATVVRVTDASAAPLEREGFLRYAPLAAGAAASLTDAGERDLALRAAKTDTAVFPIAHGADEMNGRYTPGWPGGAGHFWVGDTVRLHTGTTGVHDFNEANLRVAAISWVKREGGGQDIVLELGASYAGGGTGGVSGSGTPPVPCTCPHPPSGGYTFGTPPIVDVLWNYNTNLFDTTGTWPTGPEYNAAGYVQSGISGNTGNYSGAAPPIAPGTFNFRGDFLNRNLDWNPNGIKVQVFSDDGVGLTQVHISPFLSAGGQFEHYEASVVCPAGTIKWRWRIGFGPGVSDDYALTAADNVALEHGGGQDTFSGDAAPLPPTGSTGSIGTEVGCYALCDHRHAAQVAQITDISDVGGFFTGDDVEDALQELAARAWKQPVRAATIVAGTLASSFENGDTIDGIVLATGDRILIKNQAAGAENGIYTINASGAPTRATDFDASSEILGAVVLVTQGTANADKVFVCTNNSPITLGTTALAFAELAGDQYVLKTLGGKETINTVAASGTTETLDLALGNVHDVTLTANCTFTFTGATAGVACSFTLLARQDGTGSRTATWPASVAWPDGSAPVLATAPNAVDVLTFFTLDGGTVWFGFHAGGGAAALDDLTDVTITSPELGSRLRYDGAAWIDSVSFPELLVQDGSSAPPVTLTNEAEDDWIYADP